MIISSLIPSLFSKQNSQRDYRRNHCHELKSEVIPKLNLPFLSSLSTKYNKNFYAFQFYFLLPAYIKYSFTSFHLEKMSFFFFIFLLSRAHILALLFLEHVDIPPHTYSHCNPLLPQSLCHTRCSACLFTTPLSAHLIYVSSPSPGCNCDDSYYVS